MKNYATSSPEEEIENLERFMQTSFRPVSPRPEFVKQLHHRLTDPKIPTVRFNRPLRIRYGLLAIASLLSGVIFLITASQVIKALMKRSWGL
jgi:hypothetical protein